VNWKLVMKTSAGAISIGLVLAVAAPGLAQSTTREQRDSRYQIGMMEGVLEKAVEHGAAVMRERLRSILPADMLLSKPVRVRGIRLEGYGVVFDIDVPSLQSAPLWSFQTLDQNNLGLQSAINAMRTLVESTGDPNLQQALQRIELSVAPMPSTLNASPSGGPTPVGPPPPSLRTISGSPASTNDVAAPRGQDQAGQTDALLDNPAAATEAYRTEIKDALMEAMLDHSRGLGIGPNEWLVVVAGGTDDQPLAGLDTDVQNAVIRIKGSDLADFLGNRISHDEARQRMDVKVF